ncbi:hypothetical protein ACNFIA_31795 [Pseudomonas sp. NY15437]|uniref:hypothetical protein n=1 Tax=Pseudomonas sp. NY15437 TaxID=3400360 RepID=UPI003A8C2EBA
MVFSWVVLFFWYVVRIEIFGSLESLLGIVSDPPTVGQRRFYRFLAVSLAGTTIVGSFFMGLNIYIKRRHSKESAEGQWYDKENLTQEDLYGERKTPEESSDDDFSR